MEEIIKKLKNNIDDYVINSFDGALYEKYLFVPICVKDDFLFIVTCLNSNTNEIKEIIKEKYSWSFKFIRANDADFNALLKFVSSKITDNGNCNKYLLGQMALKRGWIKETELNEALSNAEQKHNKIGSMMFQMNLITMEQLHDILQEQTGYEIVPPSFEVYLARFHFKDFVEKYRIIPIELDEKEKTFTVAIVDLPPNLDVINLMLESRKASLQEIMKCYKTEAEAFKELIADLMESMETKFTIKYFLISYYEFRDFCFQAYHLGNPTYNYARISHSCFGNSYHVQNVVHLHSVGYCPNCSEIYPNSVYKYCIKCGTKLEEKQYTYEPKLNNANEFCVCCNKEKSLKKVNTMCGERNADGYDEFTTHGHCYLYVCDDCVPICKNCGKMIKTEEFTNLLKEHGLTCGYNPCQTCTVSEHDFCSCEHPEPGGHINSEDNKASSYTQYSQTINDILQNKGKYCKNCNILLDSTVDYCPYCGGEAITTDVVSQNEFYSSIENNNYECSLCDKNALVQIKLFCNDVFDKEQQKTCCCNLFLCEDCVVRCPKCGKIILTDKIKDYLHNLASNCPKTTSDTCISLAFCTCEEETVPSLSAPEAEVPVNNKKNTSLVQDMIETLKPLPFYKKVFVLLTCISSFLPILIIIIGIICFIWLSFIGYIGGLLHFLFISIILVPIYNLILALLLSLPIIICKFLFKNKYTKIVGQVLLFLFTILECLSFSTFCTDILVDRAELLEKQSSVIVFLFAFFEICLYHCGIPNLLSILGLAFIISSIIFIFMPLTSYNFSLLLAITMIIPAFCTNYTYTMMKIEKEREKK